MSILFVFFISLATPAPALARELPVTEAYCSQLTVDEIMESRGMEDCEQNQYFVDIAHRCLNKLKADVDATAKRFPVEDLSNSRQADKFDSSKAKEELLKADLARLLASIDTGLDEIHDFRTELIYPEDSDDVEVTGGDPEAFAMGTSCYGDAANDLDDARADFEEQRAQLKAAYGVANQLSGISQGRQASQGSSLGGEVAHGKAAGSGKRMAPAPAGDPPKSESTITGKVPRDDASDAFSGKLGR